MGRRPPSSWECPDAPPDARRACVQFVRHHGLDSSCETALRAVPGDKRWPLLRQLNAQLEAAHASQAEMAKTHLCSLAANTKCGDVRFSASRAPIGPRQVLGSICRLGFLGYPPTYPAWAPAREALRRRGAGLQADASSALARSRVATQRDCCTEHGARTIVHPRAPRSVKLERSAGPKCAAGTNPNHHLCTIGMGTRIGQLISNR